MDNPLITITSKRTGGQWTATATLSNGDFAGTCTAKSKGYAEKQAQRAAEGYCRHLQRSAAARAAALAPAAPERSWLGKMLGGFIGRFDKLKPATITATAAALSR